VSAGEAVYCGFNNPEGRYGNIFDGYRVIHEAPLCVAAEKNFHLVPDWYAVLETNFDGAPECWGRSVDEVLENCDRWSAKYALIYQDTGSTLGQEWLKHFKIAGELDWVDLLPYLRETPLWSSAKPTPKWFLIERQ
jgi:hypothetical protein